MSIAGERCTLTIAPAGWEVEANTSLTLLEAAQLAGIVLPSSCRNGTCRTCMCRLESGAVRYEIPWPGLSAEEKREGWILPCAAYPESDVRILARRAVRQK
jgi:ferredoxin